MAIIKPHTLEGSGSGVSVVAIAFDSTPFIAAYRFSAVTGWGTRYSNAGTLPANGAANMAFAPGNNALIFTDPFYSGMYNYVWSEATGFGTRSTLDSTYLGISFNRAATRALTYNTAHFKETAYTTAFGSVVYTHNTDFGPIFKARWIMNDRFVVVSHTSGSSFSTYDRSAGSSATLVSTASAAILSGSGYGKEMVWHEGNLADGSSILGVTFSGTAVPRLFRLNAAGVIGAEITVSGGFLSSRSIAFDRFGHFITGGVGGVLRCWSIDSLGNVTLLNSVTFAGGNVTSLAYDSEQDVLFVTAVNTPFLGAYRMTGAGFGSIYANPGTSVAIAATGISLMYSNGWKPSHGTHIF